jgi:hypothetical protein
VTRLARTGRDRSDAGVNQLRLNPKTQPSTGASSTAATDEGDTD